MQGTINYSHYLDRILVAFTQLRPDLSSLKLLQRQHLLHIPFENIDIFYGIPVSLDVYDIFNKIVGRRRGGYCYECNFLFHHLLIWLGFQSRLISSRVVNGRRTGPEFDHLALIVDIDGREWLVDVGFGHFATQPLLLNSDVIQNDGQADYRIGTHFHPGEQAYLAASRYNSVKKTFKPVYLFRKEAQSIEDFLEMHQYHQTSPESHFTKNLICSQLTDDGRLSLLNNRLITTIGPDKQESLLYSDHAYVDVLESAFGIINAVPEMKTAT